MERTTQTLKDYVLSEEGKKYYMETQHMTEEEYQKFIKYILNDFSVVK